MANNQIAAFKAQYQPAADAAGAQLGVSPDVLLAQWGQETGWGKSVIPGTNNLGNIKDFSGGGVAAQDNATGSTDKYRQYADPAAFAADYTSLIRRKYPDAVGAGEDPVAFATALKSGGYAEDPNYVQNVARTFGSLTGKQVAVPAATAVSDRTVVPPASPATERSTWEDTAMAVRADKPSKQPKEVFTPQEKFAIDSQASFSARAGESTDAIVYTIHQAREIAPQLVQMDTQALANSKDLDFDPAAPITRLRTQSDKTAEQVKIDNAAPLGPKIGAAVRLNGTMQAIRDAYSRMQTPRDPSYKLSEHWESELSGYTREEQDQIVSNASSSEAVALEQQIIDRKRADQKTLMQGSTATGIGLSLAAGLTDVPSLLMFAGVGKVAQLAGVGARAYAMAGRPVAAVLSSAAEGATGGLLLDAALNAAGQHYTLNDYARSAGLNAGMGLGFGLLHIKPARMAESRAIMQEASELRMRDEAALWSQAQTNLGPQASDVQLRAEADRIQGEQIRDIERVALAPVPVERRLLPQGELPTRSPEVVAALEQRYGLQNIPDPAERALAVENYLGAERILSNAELNPERVSKFTKLVGMESTSQTFLTSKNPLMQALGVTLLESGGGLGGRGTTAALSRHMNYKRFLGDFNNDYEKAYTAWSRTERGATFWSDATSDANRKEFNRLVATAVEDFHFTQGPQRQLHPAIANAMKAVADKMDLMRKAMQDVGTTGAARLGDSSAGYLTRVVSAEKVRAMSNGKKSAVVDILAQQFRDLNGYDRAFALEHARKYLDIANQRALNGHEMPLSIHDERAAGIVSDAMKANGASPEEIADVMGKFSRGGANFTKGRAELSLNTPYHIDGEEFRLMDIVDDDVPALVRRYVSRAAGEVALTQFGVQGRAGLQQLRNALTHGPDGMKITEKEMQAFDQIAAEFIGDQFGTRVKAVDNALAVTSIMRLGGMGITQMAESLNALSSLGVGRTLQSIAGMPRLIREAHIQSRSGVSKNPILRSIEAVGGELGLEHYRTHIPMISNEALAREAGMETYTVTDRAIRSGQNIQAKISFHQAIHTAQVRGMSEQIVHKAMRYLKSGTEDAALADMGFTPEVMQALRKDINKIAKFDTAGRLTDLDITKATDAAAARDFVQAVNRGASQIIQGTFIGETGKWAHSSWLKMLTQFRTFGLISVEKQWNRQAGVHGAAKAFGYMLGAMSIAIPLQAARVQLATLGMSRADADKYAERQLEPFALVKGSMNYISALGMAPDFYDALSIPLGMDGDTSGAVRGDAGRIVPAIGLANDVLKAGKSLSRLSPASDAPTPTLHDTVKNLTPFGRVPYLIPLVNALGQD